MNLAAIVDPTTPIPGTPTEIWGYDPELQCGYLRMTDPEYLEFPAVSASLLKCPTPAEMYSLLTKPMKDTEALAVGTLADLAIVGGISGVMDRFAVVDVPLNMTKKDGVPRGTPYQRGSKEAEAAYKAAAAANPGKFLASASEIAEYRREIEEICTAFHESPLCHNALNDALVQVVGLMWDPHWKAWTKWKPDVLPLKPEAIGSEKHWKIKDLKTTRRALMQFEYDCKEYGYYDQAVWYGERHEKCLARMGLSVAVTYFDFLVVAKSDMQSNRPRRAMAHVWSCPLDPAGNLLVRGSCARLIPPDGMGRVEMFLGALEEHLRTNPDPQDAATLRRLWPAYEFATEPLLLCREPKD